MTVAFRVACIFYVFGGIRWSFCSDRKLFTTRDIVELFGTGVKKRIFKLTVASQVRTRYQVMSDNEHFFLLWKDILAPRLFEDSWRTAASSSERDVTFIVTATLSNYCSVQLYWIATISIYINMGCLALRSSCIWNNIWAAKLVLLLALTNLEPTKFQILDRTHRICGFPVSQIIRSKLTAPNSHWLSSVTKAYVSSYSNTADPNKHAAYEKWPESLHRTTHRYDIMAAVYF
jgi:hypothetical protein